MILKKNETFTFSDELQTQIVRDQLGIDNLPIFNTDRVPLSPSTTSAANFDQWFRDVSGVNDRTNFNLVLTRTPMTGRFTFDSGLGFFPLDNLLFGNQNLAHNYHFTFELHYYIWL